MKSHQTLQVAEGDAAAADEAERLVEDAVAAMARDGSVLGGPRGAQAFC
jgi:hypothetical protein